MKLYTEKEVRAFFNDIYYFSSSVDDAMEQLTHIELPSEEEIEKYANFAMPDAEKIGGETYTAYKGFKLGANWMRDKIKGEK